MLQFDCLGHEESLNDTTASGIFTKKGQGIHIQINKAKPSLDYEPLRQTSHKQCQRKLCRIAKEKLRFHNQVVKTWLRIPVVVVAVVVLALLLLPEVRVSSFVVSELVPICGISIFDRHT